MVGQVCGGGAPPLTIQNRAVAHAVIPVLIRGSFRPQYPSKWRDGLLGRVLSYLRLLVFPIIEWG